MPSPRSWRGAGPSEGAPAVRLPVLRVHLALRRWSQRPYIDRMALDFRPSSFRHVTRVSPSNGLSAFFRSRLCRQALVPLPFRVQGSR